MDISYIKKRVNELFTYINYLRDSATDDTRVASELISKTKSVPDEDEKIELIKKFKKIQFFNNLKLAELEKTMPTLVELVSISKILDLDLGLTEEQELVIETNKKRTAPMYTVDKDKLMFIHKELEDAVDLEINNPSESNVEALKNLVKAMNKSE